MAGHSKWANIKRRKGAQDAARGKIFSRLNKEIMVSAKLGGGDPDANPRLRAAVAKAKAANMPMQTIDRAIKKGTGDLEGVTYEEITYEGYGPAGVAFLVEVLTDNRKRAVAEVRHLFSKYNGNLGENGCVAWIFANTAYFSFNRADVDLDQLMDAALEAGAEDIKEEGDDIEVTGPPEAFEALRSAFDEAGLTYSTADVNLIPSTTVSLEGKQAEQTIKLLEALEDSDDVQRVSANFDISEDVLESLQ